MTDVSGSSSFNPTFADLARQSLYHCGVIAEDEDPSAAEFARCQFQANLIIKGWEASGLHVWTEEEGILFLSPGQYIYNLGGVVMPSNACVFPYYQALQLTATVGAGATVIAVASTAAVIEIPAVTTGDNIGIQTVNGAMFWTTVGTPVTATSIPLAAPLPANSGGAASGAFAFDYAPLYQLTRPLKVPKARRLAWLGGPPFIETPIEVMSRQEYMDLPSKQQLSLPVQFFYSPRRDKGVLYTWGAPLDYNSALRFTWYRALQDMLTPANTFDFPQEWANPLMWRMAHEMAPGAGTPAEKVAMIEKADAYYTTQVESYDRESEPIYFGMDYERH